MHLGSKTALTLFIAIILILFRTIVVPDFRFGVVSAFVIVLIVPALAGYIGHRSKLWWGIAVFVIAKIGGTIHYAITGGWPYLSGEIEYGLTQSILLVSFLVGLFVLLVSYFILYKLKR